MSRPPQDDEKSFPSFDNILEEPILKPISENFLRIRRNLLLISLLGILYGMDTFDIEGLIISGIKINCSSINLLEIAGFSIILYQFLHFTIEAWEHLIYWRLRYTGTKLAHVTTGKFAHEGGDYPSDTQQSTLYSWWAEEKKNLKGWEQIRDEASSTFTELESFKSSLDSSNIQNQIVPLLNNVSSLDQSLKKITEIITSSRVVASLERFDKVFWKFQKIHLFKWFILELGLPLILGIAALYLMFPAIFANLLRTASISLTKFTLLS